MEAKDTVLSDKETIEIIKQYRVVKLGQILPYHWHRETQAKITWSIAKQVGIREVVEWIKGKAKVVGSDIDSDIEGGFGEYLQYELHFDDMDIVELLEGNLRKGNDTN